MAYILELVPRENKQGYMIPGYKEVFPSRIVIDKDRNIRVFKYWTDIDPPHIEYFAIAYSDKIYKHCLLKSFVDGDVCWSSAYKNCPDLPDDVLQELRDAMRVYKSMGNPFVPCDQNAKVIINF